MKKKILIVYGHPHRNGHNGLMLETVENQLDSKGVEYEVWDLYKMNFDPVMKKNEHFLAKNFKIEKDVLKLQKKISECNEMIFIFPIWWNSPPAIMKGFFDRVFSARFAYKYVKFIGKLGRPVPLLKGKKAAVFITTGSPKILYWLIEKARGKFVIVKDTLKFCGIKGKVFHYDFATQVGDRAKKKIPRLVRKGLKWLI